MKKIILVIIAFITFPVWSAYGLQIKRGESIHKEIRLNFNEEAVKNNEYVVFTINDDFDFENLDLKIDNQIITEKTFKVCATNEIKTINIDICSKENAKSGNYDFYVKVKKTSNKLADGVEYKGNDELKLEDISIPKTAQERMKSYVIMGLIGLLLLITLFFVYQKSRKFTRGHLAFEQPTNDEISLKDRNKYDFFTLDEDRTLIFELTKGKKGMPKISKLNGEMHVNGDLKKQSYQLKRDDEISINKTDGTVITKFIYY